jgi:hypothetical protein
MDVTIDDIKRLNTELEGAVLNLTGYHGQMELMRQAYLKSTFYPPLAGQPPSQNDAKTNLLQVFADKNIGYTCEFPTIKVPTTGATPEMRKAASIREKILYAVWRKSNGALLWRRWADDATLSSLAIAETGFDLKNRCAWVKRYDPRYCYWQISNDAEPRVLAFWVVYPITKDEAFKTYGVEPTSDPLSGLVASDKTLAHIDGKEWFTFAMRKDGETRVAWIGNKIVEQPHKHMQGGIGIHVAMPFPDVENNDRGAFYIEPLIPYQCELNDTFKRRGKIVRRMSAPVVYARGLMGRKLDEVEGQLAKPGGGFVPLSTNGELGLLQVSDTKMLDEHEQKILDHMMKVSGFSGAAFGEAVGANTSGDALGMYFTPTQKHIDKQMISWKAFGEAINADILRLYDTFAKVGETFSLSGYSPRGTIMPVTDDAGNSSMQYQRGMFEIEFDKSVIGGSYTSVVIPPTVTPRNQLEEKRLAMQGVRDKFYSRTTAYEDFDILSPEDEIELLKQEQAEPLLAPDTTSQLLQAQQQAQQPTAPAAAAGV